MTETKPLTAIGFAPITLQDKPLFLSYLAQESARGCEFTFANLYLWGQQNFAVLEGHIVLFSRFGNRCIYPYPLGTGDIKPILDAIIADAHARGIRCRISGMSEAAAENLAALYPGKFRITHDEGTFDYVYRIDDLADLPGKPYHAKRTNLNRFTEAYPDCAAVPLTRENLPLAVRMVDEWYAARAVEDADTDFAMEKAALAKALCDYEALDMEGMLLLHGGEALAMTMASRQAADTFDVHFEKAKHGVQGAYAAINREFARYIREKYPTVRYLNREEDMGLEGLRRAKQSYRPHHRIVKFRAEYLEGTHDG